MDSVQAMESQILAEMSVSPLGPVNDILYIDSETRTIIIPSTELLFGVETDVNVERKYFQCPRIVGDNIDLYTLGLRVNYENANGDKDSYIVEDTRVSGDYIIFSWKLEQKVVRYNGTVKFAVIAVKTDEDGVTKNAWNTTLATGTVLDGLQVDDLDYYEETEARDVLQQLLSLMDTAVATRIEEVQDECATQVQNVKDEGTAQMAAVEAKGAATLATIPSDYTEMYNTVDMLTRVSGPVIKQESEGETIAIDDSAKMPMLGLNVYGRSEQVTTNGYQLFDASKLSDATAWGATVVNNDNGTFNVTGEGVLSANFGYSASLTHEETVNLLKTGNISLYCGVKTSPYFYAQIRNATKTYLDLSNVNSISQSKDILEEMLADDNVYLRYGFYGASGDTIVPGTIKPMLYQDGDGTWEPFSGGIPAPNHLYPQEIVNIEQPAVHVYSKNLLNTDGMLNAQLVKNADGSYTFTKNGAAGDRFSAKTTCNIPAGTYTISVGEVSGDITTLRLAITYASGSEASVTFAQDKPKTINAIDEIVKLSIYHSMDDEDGVTTTFRDIMLEAGSNATDYTPYVAQQTLMSTAVLPGIPVASDGNYIDDTGQHHMVNYRDWTRGVDVQNVYSYTLTGSETMSNYALTDVDESNNIRVELNSLELPPPHQGAFKESGLCSHFIFRISNKITNSCWCTKHTNGYGRLRFVNSMDTFESTYAFKDYATAQYEAGTPIIIQYVLETPIETAIPEDELLAYKALHTNYPNTAIFNDSKALMKVAYGTDTKIYIDKKFAELQAALTNNS